MSVQIEDLYLFLLVTDLADPEWENYRHKLLDILNGPWINCSAKEAEEKGLAGHHVRRGYYREGGYMYVADHRWFYRSRRKEPVLSPSPLEKGANRWQYREKAL